MAEYPSRSCGDCPYQGRYEVLAKKQGDYLQDNTIPKPELLYADTQRLNKPQLGVPGTMNPVDLDKPPVPSIALQLKDQVPNNIGGLQYTPNAQLKQDCCCDVPTAKPVNERCPETPYSIVKQSDSGHKLPNCPDTMNIKPHVFLKKEGTQSGNVPFSDHPSNIEPLKGILKKPGDINKTQTTDPTSQPQEVKEQLKPAELLIGSEKVVGKQPCYLPQPEDEFKEGRDESMGPIGPWATGRVDWSALAGLTGTRPVVDKYSIARFSEGDWRRHNQETLGVVSKESHKANLVEWNARQALEQTRADTDKNQEDSTKRLWQREQELHRWKCELERAITAADEEVGVMQEQRRRLKQSTAVLQLPESIAGECLERRTGRADPELVRDVVEDELIKELALTAEIRDVFTRTLADLEQQLLEDKTAKQRLEYDWSDKKQAHEWESINVALTNRSTIMLFKPGATRFPDDQSSIEHWEKFTRETLEESEQTRQRSVAFRGTLDAIILNAVKDLRAQADKVDNALDKRISCTEEIRDKLENELRAVLQRLADVETLILDLRNMIRSMDFPMKKAQTRLDNRILYRPRVENCRDPAQYGLVEEVKTINESVTALMSQLRQAEESQTQLILARNNLEREIMNKRKTLEIDRDRTKLIRSHYPSAAALSGH